MHSIYHANIALGGRVEALMQLEGRAEPLFDVGGVWVSGSHAVRDPRDGLWRRVQHAGRPLNQTAPVLWNVISEVIACSPCVCVCVRESVCE